ncbi:starter unit:ACP transacylase in aflatoxin biosynthesis domain-containing protein [Sarocladium implicatum]|nr:starter unit:ACP transacylase in aflatoxin biosynthesis domain-containing protein [Sarocladium implicatum]
MSTAMRTHMLLFGDQTVEKLSSIRALVHNSKSSPAARRFLQEATDRVQIEFSRLDSSEHGWSKGFDSLLGLAEDNKDVHNVLIDTVLMCIGRCGELLVNAEQDPSILGSSERPSEVLAFCTGLLPASAAVAARDTAGLHVYALELVSVAFRMTWEIVRRAKLIEEGTGVWARTYIGMEPEKMKSILDDFHSQNSIPSLRQISIGVVSKEWLTIIGAPSSLERLQSWSPEIEKAKHARTDIGALIHCDTLPQLDKEKILAEFPYRSSPLDWSKSRLLSPSSCQEYENATYGELLEQIIDDIATNTLRIDETIDASLSSLSQATSLDLSLQGPTNHLTAVEQALRIKGITYKIVEHHETAKGPVRGGSDAIAIVGMSGRFPGSDNPEEFWEDLVAGNRHMDKVSKSRWDADMFYSEDPQAKDARKNATSALDGAWLENPGLFDNKLFNMSPREAAQTDPIHRLLLTTSWEALESAGYSPNGSLSTRSDRIASFFGQTSADWQDVLNQAGIDIYYIPGVGRAFASGRVNHHFKWGGTSLAIDAACATGIAAVDIACHALLSRECDMAVAGGGAIHVSPNTYSGLSKAGLVSNDGGCRTFSDDADGYARGEGVAVVALKRLEDAMAENDRILGVIRGSAQGYSSDSASIMQPSRISQERIYKQVLRQGGLEPEEIGYVEMHGTGTQAGDTEEMNSVISALGGSRTKDNPLYVGAVKAAVGHGEAAAGVTSLIKSVMMLRDHIIPAQPGAPFKLNRNFPPANKTNVRVATKMADLKGSSSGDKPAKILVNSFGASGSNSCVVLEEAPPAPEKTADPRDCHVVTLSARSQTSLRRNRENLLDYLVRNPDVQLPDLAYSTTARRMHETLRVAYTGTSTREIMQQLRDDIAKGGPKDPKSKVKKSRRVFMFTGQGSHYAGMAAELYATNKTFREFLSTYQDLATRLGLPEFLDIIVSRDVDVSTKSATQVQLAVVAMEIALAHMLETWGIKPDVVLGHSLGEYSALAVSGALSVGDALFLVGSRAMLMEKHLEKNSFGMLVTNMASDNLRESWAEIGLTSVDIACMNAPSVSVASGPVQDLEKLEQHLQTKQDIKAKFLKVDYGFHSAQVEPILEEFQKIAHGVVFVKPHTPIISSLTGAITKDEAFSPEHLARHARESVHFTDALRTCQAEGFLGEHSLLVEVGPDAVCLGFARKTVDLAPSAKLVPCLRPTEGNWKSSSSLLKAAYETGMQVDWPSLHREYQGSVRLLDLPTYAFDYKDFWTPYKESEPVQVQAKQPEPKVIEEPRYPDFVPTSSLQKVVSEDVYAGGITVVCSADTAEPALLRAIQGHSVAGQVICPMVIYCDMALAATKYAHLKLHGKDNTPSLSIHGMEMIKALVLAPEGEKPVVYISCQYDQQQNVARIRVYSKSATGQESAYGACTVKIDQSNAEDETFRQTKFLLQSRMKALQEQATNGKAHALLKPVIYKLFSSIVGYAEPYRGLEEAVFDASCADGVGYVKLSSDTDSGNFVLNPFWNDAAIHLCGFLVNNGLKYADDEACICPGFSSWSWNEELCADKTYTTYVYMEEVAGGDSLEGHCYVFDGDRLVQSLKGIKFHKMKKAMLEASLAGAARQSPSQVKKAKQPAETPIEKTVEKPMQKFKMVTQPEMDSKTFASKLRELEQQPTLRQLPRDPERLSQSSRSSSATLADMVPEPPAASKKDVVQTLFSIIADETGCSPEEMSDETILTDLGLDSLMAVAVLNTVKQDTGLDLEASFFMQHPTAGQARQAMLARA